MPTDPDAEIARLRGIIARNKAAFVAQRDELIRVRAENGVLREQLTERRADPAEAAVDRLLRGLGRR